MKERFKTFMLFCGRLFKEKSFRTSLLVFILIIASIIGCFCLSGDILNLRKLSDSEVDEIYYAVYDIYHGSSENIEEAMLPLYKKYDDSIDIEIESPTKVSVSIDGKITSVEIDFADKDNPIVTRSEDYVTLVIVILFFVFVLFVLPILIIYGIGKLVFKWYKNYIANEWTSFKIERKHQKTILKAISGYNHTEDDSGDDDGYDDDEDDADECNDDDNDNE